METFEYFTYQTETVVCMLLGVSIVYVIILIFCVLMLCAKVMYTRSNTRIIMLLWDFKNKHSCNFVILFRRVIYFCAS